MSNVWDSLATAESVATAGTGAANAAYFMHRAWRAAGPRRTAAILLAGVFLASVVGAAGAAGGDLAPAAEAALRAPALLINVAVSLVLWTGGRR